MNFEVNNRVSELLTSYPAFNHLFGEDGLLFIGSSAIAPHLVDINQNIDGENGRGYQLDEQDLHQLANAFLMLESILSRVKK